MASGYLALVLHTHLPFVRHPEHERPLEERWLHEAIFECYLPLLAAFQRLEAERIPFALTMSLTPPLAWMLRDELLCSRFEAHLAHLEELASAEVKRLQADPHFGPIAIFYKRLCIEARATWDRIGGDIVGELARLHELGHLDLIACSATHAYLPGLASIPSAVRAQLQIGVSAFTQLVGHAPVGVWLPECAYDPSFDAAISQAGIRYTILDSHGLTRATPQPPFGVHHPIVSPAGTAFFGRDSDSSRQVWSREMGYPGNPLYRDFYRDIGYDLPEDLLHGEVGPFGARVMTGLKYYKITGKTDQKQPYSPGAASDQIRVDAAHFLGHRVEQIRQLSATMPVPPIVVAPYDSELFGHWWFEGPQFIEALFRTLHAWGFPQSTVAPITLRGYLQQFPTALLATPAASTWGAGGFGEVWVGPAAAHFWRHIHHASRGMEELVRRYRFAEGLTGRTLDLAIRELLLLQTSDWPFILRTGSVTEYAEARVRSHTTRLRRLTSMIEQDRFSSEDIAWMRDLDRRDNFLGTLPSAALRQPFLE